MAPSKASYKHFLKTFSNQSIKEHGYYLAEDSVKSNGNAKMPVGIAIESRSR
jgi:hypothetical protein